MRLGLVFLLLLSVHLLITAAASGMSRVMSWPASVDQQQDLATLNSDDQTSVPDRPDTDDAVTVSDTAAEAEGTAAMTTSDHRPLTVLDDDDDDDEKKLVIDSFAVCSSDLDVESVRN